MRHKKIRLYYTYRRIAGKQREALECVADGEGVNI